jgi:peptide/nickel transport system substrate-binding protein
LSLIVLGSLLAGCTATVERVEVPGPTVVVTATPPPPSPQPSTLTICQDTEPETLYLYGGSPTARHVLEAIYDGPIDSRSHEFQPVILERLPDLEYGDAYFDPVTVQAGDRVVDITDHVVELEEGVQVFSAHTCRDADDPDCVVTFDGTTPIEMEQMVVSYQLLEGVSWSDGEPVTADDSVYSYEMACDSATPSSSLAGLALPTRDLCGLTASYIAAGERTVVWTGIPGYVENLYALNLFSPLPRHLWQEQLDYTAADLLMSPESNREPLGWGPFVITEWVEGDHISLERNPTYFRADEGLPRVERVVVRFADDVHGLVAMFLSGKCDIGLVRDGQLGRLHGELGEITPLLAAAQEEGLLNLVASPSPLWEHLEFGINPVPEYSRPDFFRDAQVRQAIAHCIDRQTLVDEVTFGLGQIAHAYVPTEHPLFADDEVTQWEYDPRAGQALLAEMGWVDEDEDGVVEADGVGGVRNGIPFRVELLLVSDDRQQDAIARIIRSNLADCGIQADLVHVPLEDFLADGPQGPLMGRQFDLALFHWFNGVEPPCNLYLTEQIPDREEWGTFNIAGFSNEEYDQACRAALAALPGTREHETWHEDAQRIFSEQLPDLPLFWWVRIALTRPGVTGFTLDTSEDSELWNIESLGLER